MADNEKMSVAAIAALLSDCIDKAMSKGAEPPDVTYALASLAVDMGLKIGRDPYAVLPVVLAGISHQLERRISSANDNDDARLVAPGDAGTATVH